MNLKPPAVAELEEEIERLRRRIAELEMRPTSMISETPRSHFVMPSSRELKSLYALRTLVPQLALDDSPEHFASFAAAFSYLATLPRAPKLDTSKMPSWWCSEAHEWARLRGIQADCKPNHFTLAALADGDVDHTFTGHMI